MTRSNTRSCCALVTSLLVVFMLTGCAELLAELEKLDTTPSTTPSDGLREALRVGTGRAVGAVGRADGFLGNPDIRIPIPEKLEKVERALRLVGADRVVDEFTTSMNRAAEAAAPVAKQVFLDAVKRMTFEDAMTILRGRDHEATDYFRGSAGPELERLFRPIVDEKLESVGATRSFNNFMEKVGDLPLVNRPSIDLNDYVTGEALDGLFLMLAREEERIRTDPLARTTELLKKYFGREESQQ
ncbi:MAG: DUF4197 domain-containing protein [Acidobacteria bacterium]|uniref:DUF4197 domain-containing protein n=1 Tax=Candidatus Polarisedimenticola svalbardensis TaxID=2886004 RepID=A0A8J6XX65_9BACT|nr:DUF4197 domain-containing protein [Candidatus Polarisedimenticola svalbardensis]